MWLIGGLLIYLAIKRDMEPTLLLPLGFGTLLVNIPFSGAITQIAENGEAEAGALTTLFNAGISNELFPLILFIGIGAMIDFSPILASPKLMLFGAAAQFGIFFTFCVASMFFDLEDAASIGIIGAADGLRPLSWRKSSVPLISARSWLLLTRIWPSYRSSSRQSFGF